MNAVAVIQARMQSQRLPGKVMLNLSGKPVLQHVVERVRDAGLDPVVATGPREKNGAIIEHCRTNNVSYFTYSKCGQVVGMDENDVFGRFRYLLVGDLERGKQWDIFLRLTADSPLVSPFILRLLVDTLVSDPDAVYANARLGPDMQPRTDGLVQGLGAEACRVDSFLSLDPSTLTDAEREHVCEIFYRPEWADRCRWVEPPEDLCRDGYRLTLDTPEDYALLTHLFDTLAKDGRAPDTATVLHYLDEHRWMTDINTGRVKRHADTFAVYSKAELGL